MYKAKQVRVQNKSLSNRNPTVNNVLLLDEQDEQNIMHSKIYSFDSTCFSLSFFPSCTFSNIRIGAQTVQPPPFVDHFPYLGTCKANWTAGTTVSIGQMAFQTEKQTICEEQCSMRVCVRVCESGSQCENLLPLYIF